MNPEDIGAMWRNDGVELLNGRASAARNAAAGADGGPRVGWHADLCRRSAGAWDSAASAYLRAWAGTQPFDLVAHLDRQRAFSEQAFGPGRTGEGGPNDGRAAGILDHIRKELVEIEQDPTDLEEWIDVVILALDGAWRSGHSPEEIVAALIAKQAKNESRKWPDWRTAEPGKAIEHVRDEPDGDWCVGPDGAGLVGCPVCGAGYGVQCSGPDGEERGMVVHRRRADLADGTRWVVPDAKVPRWADLEDE